MPENGLKTGKMRIFLIILFLSLNAMTLAQTQKSNDSIIKSDYDFYRDLSIQLKKKTSYIFKTEKFNAEKNFAKNKLSDKLILQAIDSIKKNGKLTTFKNGSYKLIRLLCKYPDFVESENLNHYVLYSIHQNKLIDSLKNPVEIVNDGVINYSSSFSSTFNNGIRTDSNHIFMTFLSQIENTNSKVTGSVVYKIQFLTDYAKITLSKEDIGKTFELSILKLKLVDVFDNKIILERLDNDEYMPNLDLINLDKEGNELKPYTQAELSKMINKNPVDDNELTDFSIQTVDSAFYNLFKNSPSITLEEFTKIYRTTNQESKRYNLIILESITKIDDHFILSSPIYGIDKNIEIELKN